MELEKFTNFFNKREKSKIYILFSSMLIASLLETIGLGLIFPITGIILENVNETNNVYSITILSILILLIVSITLKLILLILIIN